MAEMSIATPDPDAEPVDLSENLGLGEMAEDATETVTAQELLAAQQAAMRQRELEGQVRQAKKFGGTVPHTLVDAVTNAPLPRGAGGAYRWTFEGSTNVIELFGITHELAEDISYVLGDHKVEFTRYQQVSTWAPDL